MGTCLSSGVKKDIKVSKPSPTTATNIEQEKIIEPEKSFESVIESKLRERHDRISTKKVIIVVNEKANN